MDINIDINIERSPDIPGYILIKEEAWQHILTILHVKGVNINFLGNHNIPEKTKNEIKIYSRRG